MTYSNLKYDVEIGYLIWLLTNVRRFHLASQTMLLNVRWEYFNWRGGEQGISAGCTGGFCPSVSDHLGLTVICFLKCTEMKGLKYLKWRKERKVVANLTGRLICLQKYKMTQQN